MRRTRRIDPETGSYVHTNGAWEMDETGFSQIYQAVMTKLGTVPADTSMGCRLWDRGTITKNIGTQAKKDMKDAVQHLLDQGIIESFEVVYAEQNRANPSRLDYGWVWTAGGKDRSYDGYMAVGSD